MNVLNEIKNIVRRLLPESVCRLCGYDNPYMDDVPDYICRQCASRAEKWGEGGLNDRPMPTLTPSRAMRKFGSIAVGQGAYADVESYYEWDEKFVEVDVSRVRRQAEAIAKMRDCEVTVFEDENANGVDELTIAFYPRDVDKLDAMDPDELDAYLAANPITDNTHEASEAMKEELRKDQIWTADD